MPWPKIQGWLQTPRAQLPWDHIPDIQAWNGSWEHPDLKWVEILGGFPVIQRHPGAGACQRFRRKKSSSDRATFSPSHLLFPISLKSIFHCFPRIKQAPTAPQDLQGVGDVTAGFSPHKPGSLKYQCSTTQVIQPRWNFFPIF